MRKRNLTKLVKGTACLLCMFLLTGCGDSDSSDRDRRSEDRDAEEEKEEKEEKLTAAELFEQYLVEDLIPEYGFTTEEQEAYMSDWEDEWLEPEGILGTQIYDLDCDNQEELLLFRVKEADADGDYFLNMEVYEADEDEEEVTLAVSTTMDDCISWRANMPLSQNNNFSIVDVEGDVYILCESYIQSGAFSDGVMESYWAMSYSDEMLQREFAFEQTGGGSSDFEYTGYEYEDDEIVKEELLYSEPYSWYGDYEGAIPKYEDYEEALISWFGDYGISVKSGLKEDYVYTGESIFSEENEIVRVVDYIVKYEEDKVEYPTERYPYSANLTEYMGLRELYEELTGDSEQETEVDNMEDEFTEDIQDEDEQEHEDEEDVQAEEKVWDYESIKQAILDHYNDQYPDDGDYAIFDSESSEDEDSVTVIVRYQGGNTANVLVSFVTVDKATGQAEDDYGEVWSIY